MSRDAAESAGLPRSEEHRREVSPILGRAVEWLSLHVSTKAVAATAGLLLFAVAGIVLYLILENTSWAATEAAVSRTAWSTIFATAAAAVVSYAALVGYDAIALKTIAPHRVPVAALALGSFVGHAFTFTLGFGVLSGSAVRWRLYEPYGLSAGQMLGVGALCSAIFWLGLAAAAGIGLLVDPAALSALGGADPALSRGLAVAAVLTMATFVLALSRRRAPIRVGGLEVPVPGVGLLVAALAIGTVDCIAAGFGLWLLLPADAGISFAAFLPLFVLATVLGVASHVPGGLGVFEATLILALPAVPRPDLVGSLILFRMIYYVLPFALALGLLGAVEIAGRRVAIAHATRRIGAIARPLLPRAAALAVVGGGVVLLLSGATPAEHDRIRILRDLVPLPFVETSHLAASITGLVLLIVSHGLLRRMANAWRAAIVLLGASAVFSILKGLDLEEAAVCGGVMMLLVVSRHEFYRQAGLDALRPSLPWALAVLIAIAASIWLGLFVWRNTQYEDMLWWDFAFKADAPRFMRATAGVLATALAFAVYALVHRVTPGAAPLHGKDLAEATRLADASPRTEAQLARLGDKRFLFSADRQGFVMYGVQGRSMVAMADPVARPDQVEDLVWSFRELVDREGGIPVFYQVSTAYLPIYLDAGFTLAKLGEEAVVDLSAFTLDGAAGRKLRQAKGRAERGGLALEIVAAGATATIMDELETVSREWLADKGGKEKGFSLGFWSRAYLSHDDIALVRHAGRIVAFANIWKGAGHEEYTIDLMRHRIDAPASTMDLLFIGLMETAKAEGYRSFSLGMAPFSGLPQHRLASGWSRVGNLLYHRGGRFYNFEGLRTFKEKFKPDWRPRYLAWPGGLALPKVLLDVTALIAASPLRAIGIEEE
jgi:phosphatidylglycerol lysyltransferase